MGSDDEVERPSAWPARRPDLQSNGQLNEQPSQQPGGPSPESPPTAPIPVWQAPGGWLAPGGWQAPPGYPPNYPPGYPGYPGGPIPPGGPLTVKEPGRGRWKWVAAAAAAVLVLGVGTAAVYLPNHQRGSSVSPAATPTLSVAQKQALLATRKAQCVPSNAYEETSQTLTSALSSGDQQAFLNLAGSDRARSAMSLWWDNVTALGFTTGAATRLDAQSSDGTMSSSAEYDIAWHSAVDGSTASAGEQALPDAGTTEYSLASTVSWDGQRCAVSISRWKGMSNAPWDLPEHLYVRRDAHTIVAGERNNRDAVDHAAGLASVAYTWLHGFLQTNGHEDYLKDKGFMVFVPATGKEGVTWFTDPSDDSGYLDDPNYIAGLTIPLDPITPDLVPGSGMTSPISDEGTSRVTLLPTATRGEPLRYQQGVLVHEFVHATFGNLVPYTADARMSATMEGAAAFVEATFRASPTTYDGNPMTQLLPSIKPFRSRFTGHLPTQDQLYGNPQYSDFYYSVAATTYAYVAATRGFPAAIETIRIAHQKARSPLAAVVTSRDGTTLSFQSTSHVEAAWASWLRGQL